MLMLKIKCALCEFLYFSIIHNFMMNTMNRIFVWNCLGEANTSFYRYCKQYVETWKHAMLVILETRCDHNKLTKTFTLLGYDGVLSSEV
jgi:hypothetical protein